MRDLPSRGSAAAPLPRRADLREREVKLEAIKAGLGRLAHDFNSGLVPILGYLSMIRSDLGTDTSVEEYLEAMERSARNNVQMAELLLLATRPQRRFSASIFSLDELIKESANEFFANKPAFKVVPSLVPATIKSDKSQWKQVIQELLRNACDAAPEGGSLRIELQIRSVNSEECADLGIGESSRLLEFVVSDEGPGIAANTEVDRIFEPFYTTRQAQLKKGLGLTVVHGIVRFNQGQILAANNETRGFSMRILLPLDIVEAVKQAN
jgi:signal transduction histidine kinase